MKIFAIALALLSVPTFVAAKPAPKSKPTQANTSAYWSAQVLGPQFNLIRPKESISAGSAFLALNPRNNSTILCTALHLLGPAGGMNRQLSFSEAASRVQSVVALNNNGSLKVSAAGVATKNGRASGENEELNASYDFIAFRVAQKPKATPFRLAARNPRVGETVWVLGPVSYSARVIGLKSDGLYLQTSGAARISGYSGGPIINAKGEVVGSLVGGGDSLVMACPVSSIRALLR